LQPPSTTGSGSRAGAAVSNKSSKPTAGFFAAVKPIPLALLLLLLLLLTLLSMLPLSDAALSSP
jgi:hypothetical protein